MSPDRFYDKDADGLPKIAKRDGDSGPGEPLSRGSATDIFGTISSNSASEISREPESASALLQPLNTAPEPSTRLLPDHPPAAEPLMNRTPLPIVHEVVFRGDAPSSESSDPLLQMLRSAPTPVSGMAQPLTGVQPPTPPTVRPEIPAAVSRGGFTQLLRALNYEQPPPEQANVAEVASSVLPHYVEPVTDSAPVAISSITQLLRTINSSEGPSVQAGPADANVPSTQPSQPAPEARIALDSPVREMQSPKHGESFEHSVNTQQVVRQETLPSMTRPRAPSKSGPTSLRELHAASASVSFTQLFSGLASAKDAQAVPSEPLPAGVQQAPASAGIGGFTQVFQALGVSKVETATPATTAPPAPPASFTQMFAALGAAPVETATPQHAWTEVKPGENGPLPARSDQQSQVFTAPSTPPAAMRGAAVARSGASFTQMFQALDTPIPEAQPPRSSSQVSSVPEEHHPDAPEAAGASSSKAVTYQSAASPVNHHVVAAGSYRHVALPSNGQTFISGSVEEPPTSEAIQSSTSSHSAGKTEPTIPAPASFTQMFQTLDAEPTGPAATGGATPVAESSEIATSATAPGSFTQLFAQPAAPTSAQPEIKTRSSGEAAPGSLTEILRSVDAQPIDPPRASLPRDHAVPPAASSPGTFTQMFSTLAAPSPEKMPPPASVPRAKEGSFTQLFATLSERSEEAPHAPQSHPPFASPYANTRDGFSQDARNSAALQGFSTPRINSDVSALDAGYASPPLRSPQAPVPAAPTGGGLTQLLRTMDQSGQPGPQVYAEPARALPQQPGSFTATYETLDGGTERQALPPHGPVPFPITSPAPPAGRDATQAFHLPSLPAAPSAPPVSVGPSEFTRILNASMLRESGLRGGGEAAGGATAPTASAAQGMGLPAASAPTLSSMAMPSVTVSAGAGGASATPHLGVLPPHLPPAPHIPQAKLPVVPKPTAPVPGKMQQFLPLLLILIIFLLLAILIAVIFLMKH